MFPINGKFDGISPDLDLMDQYLSLKISIYHQGHIQHTMHSKTRTVLYTKVIYLSDIPSGSNEWRKDLIPLNSTDGTTFNINMVGCFTILILLLFNNVLPVKIHVHM
eukprot:CAMPEP_0170105678 /NCGR_PEP_ID=MMETSP0020_2-20130122/4919_1 /TAXON_ID=98059 /ORGANISM="Dinobryon sp., Strain UTEXLB2267" /LENGTH=106 /DNA_ID=CAMNT_0010329855 /DNA_START=121 /DNA_END=438 /DNA_ORIENTATION=+